MSITDGVRITYKQIRPNPLFQDWLRELYEEAKEKKSKLKFLLKEALDSISKYPLPLHSGAECAILKGFDKRLCLFLDKRLEVYKENKFKTSIKKSLSPGTSSSSSDENNTKQITQTDTFLEKDEEKSQKPTDKRTVRKGKLKFKSASYSILMVLVDLKKNQSLYKNQLIEAAHKYCEDDMTQIWTNMTRLLAKGLVKKSKGNKPKFSLTAEGYSIAKELLKHIQTKCIDGSIFDDDDNLFNSKITKPKEFNDEVIITEDTEYNLHEEKVIQNSILLDNVDKNIPDVYSVKSKETNVNVKDNMLVQDIDFIEMQPGAFNIILLIDKCETSGLSKKNDPTITQFYKYPDLKYEYRNLKVGDFTWVAQHKLNKHQELVLPYVVERKRMDDLASSIKDGRFHEQKFRLRKCGINHVIYMVENHGSNKHVGLPIQTLMQALANTSVQDGFKIHITDSLNDSVRFLAIMTLRLMYEYQNNCLKGHNKEAKDGILMTFDYFNKASVKNKPLSVTDTFIKLLLQLKGVSVEKALAVTNIYKTPRLLMEAYQACDQKAGEMLLANLRFGSLSQSVGPNVSKSIFQLFTSRNLY